jgi:hypothetical protein
MSGRPFRKGETVFLNWPGFSEAFRVRAISDDQTILTLSSCEDPSGRFKMRRVEGAIWKDPTGTTDAVRISRRRFK